MVACASVVNVHATVLVKVLKRDVEHSVDRHVFVLKLNRVVVQQTMMYETVSAKVWLFMRVCTRMKNKG